MTVKRGIAPLFLRNGVFWAALRTGALISLVLVLRVSWGMWGIEGVSAVDPLMYTNVGNSLFWVVLMMGLILLVPLTGRLWCGVCPLGYVNELVSRWGLSKTLPRFLRNSFVPALMLLAVVLMIGIFRIHHFPGATAILLVVWVGLALVLGLVFRGRSICSGFCPVGSVLGMYAGLALPQMAAADTDKCTQCRTRECRSGVQAWNQMGVGRLRWKYRIRRHACPVDINVWEKNSRRNCLMCFNCMRICPVNNVRLGLRNPVVPLWEEGYRRFSEVIVGSVLLGFLMLSYLRFWPGLTEIVAVGPLFVSGAWGVSWGRFAYLVWAGLLLPFLIVFLPSLYIWTTDMISLPPEAAVPDTGPVGRGMGRRVILPLRVWLEPAAGEQLRLGDPGLPPEYDPGSLRGLASSFLPALIPVFLGGHLVLALVKLNSKFPYFLLGLRDPSGVRTYMAIEELGVVSRPDVLLPMGTLKWALVFVMGGSIILSGYAAVRISREKAVSCVPYFLQILIVGTILAGGLKKWLF